MTPQDNRESLDTGIQQPKVETPDATPNNNHPTDTSPSDNAEKCNEQGVEKNIGSGKEGEEKAKEQTRSTMALLFVLGFFAILFLCYAYAISVKASLSELKEALIAIIGSLSGMIGFIVGYYYKSAQEK